MKINYQITFLKLFLFSFSFMLLLTLGVWQLNKDYHTKIKRIEFKNFLQENPISINSVHNTIKTPALVEITGLLLENKSIYIEPRTYKGQVGYHKITPLKKDNKLFLINRGFIKDKTSKKSNNKNISIIGIIIKIPKKNFLSLKNDIENNKWYTFDIDDLSKFYKINTKPYIIYEKNNNIDNMFKQVTPNIVSKVNHLHYAITWFLVALSICIIFVISLREVK